MSPAESDNCMIWFFRLEETSSPIDVTFLVRFRLGSRKGSTLFGIKERVFCFVSGSNEELKIRRIKYEKCYVSSCLRLLAVGLKNENCKVVRVLFVPHCEIVSKQSLETNAGRLAFFAEFCCCG